MITLNTAVHNCNGGVHYDDYVSLVCILCSQVLELGGDEKKNSEAEW